MASSGEAYRLSSAQEQLWFVDQLRSGTAVEYMLSATLRLRGPLDAEALVAALTEIAQRHAVLRSHYDDASGEPVQVVLGAPPLNLTVLDLAGVPLAGRDQHIAGLRATDLRTPIDLRKTTPWRISLLQFGPNDAVLLIAVHHIAFDGLSWSVLAAELEVLYGAFLTGTPAALTPLALQYHDAAARQRGREDAIADRIETQLDYWRDRLAGLAPLDLPTDRPRPAQWEADGDCVDFTVPAELAGRLVELGRSCRATPFMTHLAAFQLLLARYSGQRDLAVGVSVATRRPDEQQLIGMFLNTLALRVDLAGDPSFTELLRQVQRNTIEAYTNQDVPFDRLTAKLAPGRDSSRNPLFQAGIAWYDARRKSYHLPGLDVALCPPLWTNSAFDLSLHLAQFADGSVQGQLVYPTSLFDRSRMERMAANYLRLLASVLAEPELPVSRLQLLAEPEQRRLQQLGRGATGTAERSLTELFFEQAQLRPDAPALVSDAGQLSYRELASRVDALAGYLRTLGVGVETPVGVALERSADLVIALLAILTAGATYVPLPPEHPRDRLSYVASNARLTLILTHAELRHLLPAGFKLIALDELADRVAAHPAAEHVGIHGLNAAYIVYTSGSTGQPKGVTVTHDGIRNRVLWSLEHQLEPADRVLQKTTTGFDASMWELLTPLVAGCTLVLVPPQAQHDPSVLIESITRHRATVLQLVPSVLRLLVSEPAFAQCSSLRLVCSAGEALPVALCRQVTDLLDVELYNTYGPTECSIDATAWRYQGSEAGPIAPIGMPLSNMCGYVVDSQDQLVPIGVPGQLCISGTGLARGYLSRPDLTAAQFSPHPYAEAAGERWYRTGDLARWHEDGWLEFLGRTDDQLKINGIRIEPAEIEAALCSHPSVTAAAVLARPTPASDLSLVGYVAAPADPPSPAELHEHLAALLPAAMIPPSIIVLDAFMLGPNGKLDRAQLPEVADSAQLDLLYVAPRTAIEQTVADIMAEVLGVAQVGIHHDFFALGGHSLLAIRLILRLRRVFELELAIGDLFTDRTVEGLAARIASSARAAAGIQAVPRDRELPLSFSQERLWFLDQLDLGSTEYLISQAMRLRGPLDVEALRQAVDRLVARHEVLRTRYLDHDGRPVQVVDPPAPVEFTVHDLSGQQDPSAQGLAVLDVASRRGFELARDHPLRVTVVRIAPDEHLVALNLHHIAFDAWSMDILFRDLNEAYQAVLQDRPAGPRLPLQYADFAAWQREEQSRQDIAGQLDYWRARLAELSPLELLADRPRPAQRDPRGDTVTVSFPPSLADAVAELAGRHGATPFMLLLAGFQVLLGRYTGRTDISVGTPVAGRTRHETEELVGFFTNTLIMRADLSDEPTFASFLGQVRDRSLEAFANQDVPFEHLVDALQPGRDLSRNPLFQIMFELQHLPQHARTLGPCTVEPIRSGSTVAKFDLTVSVQQRAEGDLRCVFEYATGLFDRDTIERLAGHYLRLVHSITDTPDRRLADLELLDEDERHRLLSEWPDPAAGRLELLDPSGEHELCVPQLFQRQVTASPDAVAAVCGGQQLSYAELDARANRFAHRLQSMGVGPEVVVGSCLERSLDAVVVLLGVLKAGGVYAPFDPQHPTERLDFMLADARARVVVTTRRFAGGFGSDRYRLLIVDDDSEPVGIDPTPWLARPSNLAYIIYTSGSTGQPKGVLIEHRSYAQHCRVIADAYGLAPGERVVLLSALTFDVAMDQIAATLLAGACIVVSDPGFWSPAELPARLSEQQVTIMEITPAYYRESMRSGAAQLATLKLMNVGSDVVTVADGRQWIEAALPGRFLCNYGPTEATVTCFLHPFTEAELIGRRPGAALPIGRPVAGTQGYILDADLRPVPVGVPGELCLGGTRLARGYHDRPALTADRFVPNPMATEPGSRLYRTGDLVRYRPDGAVEFLGRIDHQVKIRGLRIELGEIEAALARHPAILAAVVITVAGAAGDPQLAAYLVCQPGTAPDALALRAHLRGLLPDYMIPSLWTQLDELPTTTSGKLDRRALPSPAAAGGPYVAPRTPAEEVIAGIWREVLELDEDRLARLGLAGLGLDDDFFALGGHSLLATRVLARLRRAFAVDIALRSLFEATTIAELAELVSQAIEDEIAQLSDSDVAQQLAAES